MNVEKFLKGFGFAFKGLAYSFKTQLNFKVHCLIAALVIIMGWYFSISPTEWILLSLVIGLVLIVELINTAIETLVDLVSPGFHYKAGIVKDVAAASVLLTALTAVIIGLIIFIPKILLYYAA